MRKHLIIPDSQVTPDTPTDHLGWIGKYIVEKQPDVIVHLGDFADMESLSSYDEGKMQAEGRRIKRDIKAARSAMNILVKPMFDLNSKKRVWKEKLYRPEMHLTIGNHENRITRCIENDAKFDGLFSLESLKYELYGWKVHPFLKPVEIDGVHYCHYFCNPLSSKPVGGENILLRIKKIGLSFVQGHQQVYMVGCHSLSNGKRIRGLVQGACYLHDEDYRGFQSNNEWRGIFMLHEVCGGDYSLMEISLDYLCRKYEKMPLWEFMSIKYPDLFKQSTWMQYQKNMAKLAA